MRTVHNLPHMDHRRKKLRKEMTYAENALWQMIRNEQLGVKFRRQHSIDSFVVDFYCAPLKLAIEVDGSTHLDPDRQLRDQLRQRQIEAHGVTFVRITDPQVISDATSVLRLIKEAIDSLSTTS